MLIVATAHVIFGSAAAAKNRSGMDHRVQIFALDDLTLLQDVCNVGAFTLGPFLHPLSTQLLFLPADECKRSGIRLMSKGFVFPTEAAGPHSDSSSSNSSPRNSRQNDATANAPTSTAAPASVDKTTNLRNGDDDSINDDVNLKWLLCEIPSVDGVGRMLVKGEKWHRKYTIQSIAPILIIYILNRETQFVCFCLFCLEDRRHFLL